LAGLIAFVDIRGPRAKVKRAAAKAALELQRQQEDNAPHQQTLMKNKALMQQVLNRTKDQEKVLLFIMEASLQVILAHVMIFLFGRYREERESKHRLREIGNEIDTFLVRLVRNLNDHAKKWPEQTRWQVYMSFFKDAKAYFKYLFDL